MAISGPIIGKRKTPASVYLIFLGWYMIILSLILATFSDEKI